jgi:hypothetical protein
MLKFYRSANGQNLSVKMTRIESKRFGWMIYDGRLLIDAQWPEGMGQRE